MDYDLEAYAIVNATVGLAAFVLMTVLLLAVSGLSAQHKGWRCLLWSMRAFFVGVCGELCVVLPAAMPSLPGWLSGMYMAMVGRVVADVCGAACCSLMMTSVLMGVAGLTHDGRSGLAIRAIWISSAIVALLILLNPLTGILFSLDEAGGLARGPLFFLPYLLICAQALVVLVVVIAERPQLPPYVMVRLRMCMAVFTLTSLCDVMLPGLELAYPCVSLLYVVLVMGVEARQREELILARTEASESRARLLSGQISNHFVFNSLAAIRELIAMDPPLAEQAVIDFSDYLRSHLDVMSTTRLVPFSQELDHVRHYVSLEMADASEPLEVRYDLEVEDFLVPPLTVQPLVENAIRHGIGTREEGGTVTVATRRAEKAIEISVTDDGRGFSSATARQDERARVGLQNVRERLERQCSGTLTVEGSEGGTTATMVIPMGEDA